MATQTLDRAAIKARAKAEAKATGSRDNNYYIDAGAPSHHPYNIPAIKALLPAQSDLTILDAGSGNGHLADKLQRMGHAVWGVDISESGIAQGRSAYPAVTFAKRDLYEPMGDLLPEGGVDLVVSCEVIEHLFAPPRFLANMFEAIKPGGHIIVTTPYHGYWKNLLIALTDKSDHHTMVDEVGGHIKFFSRRTLTAMLREAGFTDIVFRGAGRFAPIWASMAVRAQRPA